MPYNNMNHYLEIPLRIVYNVDDGEYDTSINMYKSNEGILLNLECAYRIMNVQFMPIT